MWTVAQSSARSGSGDYAAIISSIVIVRFGIAPATGGVVVVLNTAVGAGALG